MKLFVLTVVVLVVAVAGNRQPGGNNRPTLTDLQNKGIKEKTKFLTDMLKEQQGQGGTGGSNSSPGAREKQDKNTENTFKKALETIKKRRIGDGDEASEADDVLKELVKKIDVGRVSPAALDDLDRKLKGLPKEKRERILKLEITEDDIGKELIDVLSRMDPKKLKKFIDGLSPSEKGKLCGEMLKTSVAKSGRENFGEAEMDCIGTRTDVAGANKDNVAWIKCQQVKGEKRRKDKGEIQTLSPQSQDVIVENPDCLEDGIDELPGDRAGEMYRNARNKLSRKQMEKLAEKAKEGITRIRDATKDQVERLAEIADGLTTDEIAEIPDDKMIETAEEWCEKKDIKPSKRTAIVKKVLDILSKISENAPGRVDKLKKAKKCIGSGSPKQVKKLKMKPSDEEELSDEDDDLSEAQRDKRAKKVLESTTLTDAGKLDATKTKKVSRLLCGFPVAKLIEKLNATVAYQNMEAVSPKKKCDKKKLKAIFDILWEGLMTEHNNTEIDAIPCPDILKFKRFCEFLTDEAKDRLVDCMAQGDVEVEDNTEVEDDAEEKCKLKTKAFKEKNKNNAKFGKDVFNMRGSFKDFDLKDIGKMPVSEIIDDPDVDFSNIETKRSQGIAIAEMVTKERDVEDWGVEVWKKCKKFVKNMKKTDIREMTVSGDTPDIADGLQEEIDDMPEEQAQEIANKAEEWLETFREFNFTENFESDMKKIGRYMGLLLHIFPKIPGEKMPIVFRYLGRQTFRRMKRRLCTKLALEYLKNVERNGEVVDVTSASELTADDVADMGGLIRCLPADQMKKLTKEAIEENIEQLKKIRGREAVKAFIKRFKELFPEWKDNPIYLCMLSILQRFSDQDDTKDINGEAIAECVEDTIVPDVGELRDDQEEAAESGMSAETTAAEKTEEEKGLGEVVDKSLSGMEESQQASDTRRRRSTPSPKTCIDMKTFQKAVTSVDKSQFTAMTGQEFENCLSFFGEQGTWSTEHLHELAAKAKTVLPSDITTWTSADHIQPLGSILAGLPFGEIGSMALDTAALEATGKHDHYSWNQLESGFAKWLTSVKSDDSTTITAEELKSIGQWACGATAAHIRGIPNAAYESAAMEIGTLLQCSPSKAEEWANKAKALWGSDVSQWEASYLATLGSMFVGLSGSDLTKIPLDNIWIIIPEYLKRIPSSKITYFTKLQLEELSYAQAKQLESNTLLMKALELEKRNVIHTKAGEEQEQVVDSPGGAAAATSFAVLIAVTTFLATII